MKSVKVLIRFFTSLTCGIGCFFIAWGSISLFVKFFVPGGVKSLGSFPNGFVFWVAVLLSLYLSAKLAGRVWKADN